jgi:hypothetical protein
MAWRKTKKGLTQVDPPFPMLQEVPDRLWNALLSELRETPDSAEVIIKRFCKTFGIDPEAVNRRGWAEVEAFEEQPKATIH